MPFVLFSMSRSSTRSRNGPRVLKGSSQAATRNSEWAAASRSTSAPRSPHHSCDRPGRCRRRDNSNRIPVPRRIIWFVRGRHLGRLGLDAAPHELLLQPRKPITVGTRGLVAMKVLRLAAAVNENGSFHCRQKACQSSPHRCRWNSGNGRRELPAATWGRLVVRFPRSESSYVTVT
jgi:hypothetical protein